MTTCTPTLELTDYLGRDVQLKLTTPREYTRTVHDPIVDGEVTVQETTSLREYANLSLARAA